MTKKNLNREIKDAAAPAIEVVRLLVEQMRQQGQSDAEILAALDRLERDNPAKVDADVNRGYGRDTEVYRPEITSDSRFACLARSM
jgi:hypothetical protein